MSRAGTTPDVIPVRAGNNVYTVLLAVATIVQALALVALFMKYHALFGDYPFKMGK